MLGIALRRVYEFDDGNRRTGVWAALMSSGHEWPGKRVTVNLAPCGVRKTRSSLDTAIAIGLLFATDCGRRRGQLSLLHIAMTNRSHPNGGQRVRATRAQIWREE